MLMSFEEFQKRDSEWALSHIEFDYQCEQTKSHARVMSYQSVVGNIDEMSNDQCVYDRQCMLRVVGGCRSVPG